jgi:regulatory protein
MRVLKPKKSRQSFPERADSSEHRLPGTSHSAEERSGSDSPYRRTSYTSDTESIEDLVEIVPMNASRQQGQQGADPMGSHELSLDSAEKNHKTVGRRSKKSSKNRTSTGSETAAVDADDAFTKIYQRGVALLAIREHSQFELRNKLRVKFQNNAEIDEAIDQLVREKYLSNERFAEAYVRMRKARGFGPSRIRSELSARGIADELIHDNLNLHSASWIEIAEQQYLKKFGDSAIHDYREWSKRASFLQGRGFNREHIDGVLPEITEKSDD